MSSRDDPQKMLGPATGTVVDPEGKQVGWYWENPKTEGMTKEQRDEYWKRYHTEKKSDG